MAKGPRLAVLILILIAIVAVRELAPLQDVTPRDLDLEADVTSVERAPLGSDELFDLLYERRDGAPSIKIDLFDARIDAVIDGKAEGFESGEKAAVRQQAFANYPREVRQALVAAENACRHAGGARMTLALNAVRRLDLTGDGRADYIVDFHEAECVGRAAYFCGSAAAIS